MPSPTLPPSCNIGDLAREFDVTTRTIRFYEDQGLLTPERRGQTRLYTPADRVKLILILRGRRLGFTLAESQELIGLYDPASGNIAQLTHMLEKLAGKRAALARKMNDIEQMQLELNDVEQRCRKALAAASDTTHNQVSSALPSGKKSAKTNKSINRPINRRHA